MSPDWSVHAGRLIVLRASTAEFDPALAFPRPTVLGPGDAPPNISMVAGRTDDDWITSKHELHVQARLALVSADADRICRSAVRNAHELGIGSSRLALHASVYLTPSGHAILIDRQLGYTWWGLDRRIQRLGATMIDTEWAHVDPDTATVHLADAGGDRSSATAGRDPPDGGSYPIRSIAYRGWTDDADARDLLEAVAHP